MLVSLAKMTLPVTFMMDVVVLIIVGSSILLVKYLASPTVLGFFCNDEVKTISMFHVRQSTDAHINDQFTKDFFFVAVAPPSLPSLDCQHTGERHCQVKN